jgi:hypothetical protein
VHVAALACHAVVQQHVAAVLQLIDTPLHLTLQLTRFAAVAFLCTRYRLDASQYMEHLFRKHLQL